jgi:hypothetical protein
MAAVFPHCTHHEEPWYQYHFHGMFVVVVIAYCWKRAQCCFTFVNQLRTAITLVRAQPQGDTSFCISHSLLKICSTHANLIGISRFNMSKLGKKTPHGSRTVRHASKCAIKQRRCPETLPSPSDTRTIDQNAKGRATRVSRGRYQLESAGLLRRNASTWRFPRFSSENFNRQQ